MAEVFNAELERLHKQKKGQADGTVNLISELRNTLPDFWVLFAANTDGAMDKFGDLDQDLYHAMNWTHQVVAGFLEKLNMVKGNRSSEQIAMQTRAMALKTRGIREAEDALKRFIKLEEESRRLASDAGGGHTGHTVMVPGATLQLDKALMDQFY